MENSGRKQANLTMGNNYPYRFSGNGNRISLSLPPKDLFAHCNKCDQSIVVSGYQARVHQIIIEFRTKHNKCLRKVR